MHQYLKGEGSQKLIFSTKICLTFFLKEFIGLKTPKNSFLFSGQYQILRPLTPDHSAHFLPLEIICSLLNYSCVARGCGPHV